MTLNRTENPIRLQQVQYWIGWLSKGFATGKWDSLYLGRGYEFQGIASFDDDPDIVRLNWPATFSSGELMVSQFAEERSVDLYLLADMSASMAFGSQITKLDRLALLSAIISFSAQRIKDRFHFVGYTDKIERSLPHGNDKAFPLILAKKIMEFDWHGKSDSGLPHAALEVGGQKSLVIMISDFLGDMGQIEKSLRMLAPRHKVLPLVLWDEREVSLPGTGFCLYPFRDLETGALSYVFLTQGKRKKFEENSRLRRQSLETLFARYGTKPHFIIGGDSDGDIKALMKIFLRERGRI